MVDTNYSSDRNPNLTAQEVQIINYFAQGQKQSIASDRIKLEATETSVRLSTVDGALLGIVKQTNEWQRKALVINRSLFRSSIIQTLRQRGYITKQRSSHPDFTEHHFYRVPKGYRLQYTEIIQLWRVWWNNRRERLNEPGAAIDLPVFTRGRWYAIQDLHPHQGNFAIRTAAGESTYAPEDYLVWLERSETPTQQARQSEVPTVNPATERPLPATAEAASSDDPEIDLESYLNTFDTENTVDVDRIEGIYNIDELLNTVERPDPDAEPASPAETAPSIADSQQQQSLRRRALAVLAEYLANGEVITQTEVSQNAIGQDIERKVTTITRGCPRWVIEQVLKLES